MVENGPPIDTKTLIQKMVEITGCSALQAELALLDNANNLVVAVNQILEQNPAYECWIELKSRKKKEEEKFFRGRGTFVRGDRGRGGFSFPHFRGARGGATFGQYEKNSYVMPKWKKDVAMFSDLIDKDETVAKADVKVFSSFVPVAPSLMELHASASANSIASPIVNRDGPISFAEAVIAGKKKSKPSPPKVQPLPGEVPEEVASKNKNTTDSSETKETTLESRIVTIPTPPHNPKVEQCLETKSPQMKANEPWTLQLKNDLGITGKPIEKGPPKKERPKKASRKKENRKKGTSKSYLYGNVEFLYNPEPIPTDYSFGYIEPAHMPTAPPSNGFNCGDSQVPSSRNPDNKVGDIGLSFEQLCRAAQFIQLHQYTGNNNNYNVARSVQPPLGFPQNIYGFQAQGHPASYESSTYTLSHYMIPQQGGTEQIVQPPPGFANCYIQAQGNTLSHVPQYDFSQYSMQQSTGNAEAIQVHQLSPQEEEGKTASGAKLSESQEFIGAHFFNSNSKRIMQNAWKF